MAEKTSLWNARILGQAIVDSFRKLDPRGMVRNPVMFVVEVGSVLTTVLLFDNWKHHAVAFSFNLQITLWLWFTVLFANFAEADVGVAMNSGTQAAKEAGNMVDLDSNPTKLIEIVEIGKQLLMTRGALTTFSIANDVAKYFAIIPAMFAGVFPVLNALNIMHLHSPQSAILSAVIFNAVIIVALIPLALRGVKYEPKPADVLLRQNLLLYGVGGIIIPFIGIWAIDWCLFGLHMA
jgi:high-affinity K+ transport system ATPase subunit B